MFFARCAPAWVARVFGPVIGESCFTRFLTLIHKILDLSGTGCYNIYHIIHSLPFTKKKPEMTMHRTAKRSNSSERLEKLTDIFIAGLLGLYLIFPGFGGYADITVQKVRLYAYFTGAYMGYCIQAFFGISSPISAPYFWVALAFLSAQIKKSDSLRLPAAIIRRAGAFRSNFSMHRKKPIPARYFP